MEAPDSCHIANQHLIDRLSSECRSGAYILIALFHAAVFVACSSLLPGPDSPLVAFPETEEYRPPSVTERQRLIVQGSRSLEGKKALVVGGVTYPNDCTGLVRAAYAFASIDLAYRFNDLSGNGVRRLYETLRSQNLVYAVRYPAPADIVFWNDTYDANGNGKADDELTHVGVVISAEADGSIVYLHYHYRLGPVMERMNLLRPDDESRGPDGPVNSILRMRGSPGDVGTNAAQLFNAFGQGYKLIIP
jgi:hypothetical protein